MDTNLILGCFALLFGVISLLARFVAPTSSLFSKVEGMKERFGDTAGLALHWLAYTVAPLAIGAGLVYASLAGG